MSDSATSTTRPTPPKPVSTAQQTALDLKATTAALTAHEADTTAIHGITDTAALVTTARTVSTTTPLSGGGALSGNLTLTVGAASDTATGVVELATAAEVLTGTDTTRAVTAAGATGAFAPKYVAINAQTGTTYTFVLGDDSKLVTLSNAAAITLTVPANSTVAYPTGTQIDLAQIGAGQVTVTQAGGVTVNATPTKKIRAQYGAATLDQIRRRHLAPRRRPGNDMTVGIVASAHVESAAAATKWVNHIAIAAPRNGTATHTIDPASDTALTGTNFTPTASRLLLVVIEGAVTTYGTTPGTPPSGWTQQAVALSGTGLYCWTRTAAGSDTLAVTHNAANYPVMFHWFEFAAGSTWVNDVSATGVDFDAANPNLTGLTGTNLVMAAKASGRGSGSSANTASWGGGNVEILDHDVGFSTTDGYTISIGYTENYASASYQPTCTFSNAAFDNCEAITWAVHLA